MIDSVVLQFHEGEFRMSKADFFDGTRIQHVNQSISIKTLISNQRKKITKKGRYFPVITPTAKSVHTYKKGKETAKKIELQVSLPKLLYGTNLWEITEHNLDQIIDAIIAVMKEAHITVTPEQVRAAPLKRIDFAKSIRVPCFYGNARSVIHSISSIATKPSSDIRLRDYYDHSNGCALKFHNRTQGYCVYDKFGEITINGYTKEETEAIQWLKDTDQVRNLVRFEFSLQRKDSLEAFLRRRIIGKKKDFTLEDVFNKELCKSILLEKFDACFPDVFARILSLTEMRDSALEAYLRNANMKFEKQKTLFYFVYLAIRSGVQGALEKMKEEYSDSTFRRHKKELIKICAELPTPQEETPYLLKFLREEHERFELYAKKDVQKIVNHC